MAILQCPACRSPTSHALYRWDAMPLGILTLPRSEKEALLMPRYVIDLRRCATCGHVYHTDFDSEKIAYQDDSTMVFNRGPSWIVHQRALADKWINDFELKGKKVLEIGCGEGSFLEHFLKSGCICVGFEPGSDADAAISRGITVLKEDFQSSNLATLRPDALICRHVIEHLGAPIDLLQSVALACSKLDLNPVFLAEVPRIDKALEQNRISDFFYEHVSHFTEESFRTLFEISGFEVRNMESRYGDEVIVLAATPAKQPRSSKSKSMDFKVPSERFNVSVHRQIEDAEKTMEKWRIKKQKIALWGSAGKAAALINMLGFTKDYFPIVIDSDPNKFGHFVPGTGQEIRPPSYLKDHPVNGILICTNWRARDIEHEIRSTHNLNVPLYVQFKEKIVELTSDLDL